MKHRKIKLIPAKEEEVVSHTTCDICKRSNSRDPSNRDRCDTSNTEMEFTDTSNCWPEGGETVVHSFDICGECFISKVVPAMFSLGAASTIESFEH